MHPFTTVLQMPTQSSRFHEGIACQAMRLVTPKRCLNLVALPATRRYRFGPISPAPSRCLGSKSSATGENTGQFGSAGEVCRPQALCLSAGMGAAAGQPESWMTPASEGLLFIATGDRHRREALANAVASRQWAGDRPIVLITDAVSEIEASGVFDQVLTHSQPVQGYRDKIAAMVHLPFAQTLFLDSDAQLTAPVESLFQAQGCADLAAVQAPVRLPMGWRDPDVPDLFSEINSGVMLWRRSRKQGLWCVSGCVCTIACRRPRPGLGSASLRSVLWRFVQQRVFASRCCRRRPTAPPSPGWPVGVCRCMCFMAACPVMRSKIF